MGEIVSEPCIFNCADLNRRCNSINPSIKPCGGPWRCRHVSGQAGNSDATECELSICHFYRPQITHSEKGACAPRARRAGSAPRTARRCSKASWASQLRAKNLRDDLTASGIALMHFECFLSWPNSPSCCRSWVSNAPARLLVTSVLAPLYCDNIKQHQTWRSNELRESWCRAGLGEFMASMSCWRSRWTLLITSSLCLAISHGSSHRDTNKPSPVGPWAHIPC